MAQLIRVIATLEGTAHGAGCTIKVAEEWRPFLAVSNAFTSEPRGQQRRTSLMIERRASRARRSIRCSRVDTDSQIHSAKPMAGHRSQSRVGRQLAEHSLDLAC